MKRLTSMLIVIMLCVPLLSPVVFASDSPSSWAIEQVNEAISANIVPTTLQSRYNQPITRAEFCALAVALYENVKGEITERRTFADTNDVNVQKMAALGVVGGTDATRNLFSPDTNLTREQAAVILARLAETLDNPLPKLDSRATDRGSFSSWAIEAIGQVQAVGIMGGTGNNMFSPSQPYTREQSILTILRLYKYEITSFDWWLWDITIFAIRAVDRIEASSILSFNAGEGNKFLVMTLSAKLNHTRANPFLERIGLIRIIYDGIYQYDSVQLVGYSDDMHFRAMNPLATRTGVVVFRVPDTVADKPLVMRFGGPLGERYTYDHHFNIQS